MAWTHSQYKNTNPGSATKYKEYAWTGLETKLKVDGTNVKTILDSTAGVNGHLSDQILAIPAGSCPEDRVLPGVNLHGKCWVDEIFHAVASMLSLRSGNKIRYQVPPKPLPWLLRIWPAVLLLAGISCGAGIGSAVGIAWGARIDSPCEIIPRNLALHVKGATSSFGRTGINHDSSAYRTRGTSERRSVSMDDSRSVGGSIGGSICWVTLVKRTTRMMTKYDMKYGPRN